MLFPFFFFIMCLMIKRNPLGVFIKDYKDNQKLPEDNLIAHIEYVPIEW